MSFKEGFDTTLGIISAIFFILLIYFYSADFLSWAKDSAVSGWNLIINLIKAYPIQSCAIGALVLTLITINIIRGKE